MINSRYSIVKRLGKGRSSVFLCNDKHENSQEKAVKILSGIVSEEEKLSFINEFYTLQNLDHPSIIKAKDQGEIFEWNGVKGVSAGDLFFTEEYFNGKDLNSFVCSNEDKLTELVVGLAAVLFYLHQSKYIYYDLKPENILFSNDNDFLELKLIDFGLAKYAPPSIANVIYGSAEYIAPELLKKEQHDHRVDLYSLGIMLYKIIYGRFPFSTKSEIEIYKQKVENEFEYPESIYSDQIIGVLKKLLRKNPDERYFSALDIICELRPKQIEMFSPFWGPAKNFTNRPDSIRILKKYLSDKEENEVLTIKGSPGTGKTAILHEFKKQVPGSIYLDYDLTRSGQDFIEHFLSLLLYSPMVYNSIDDELKRRINNVSSSAVDNIIEEVKSIISSVARTTEFSILFDNFNQCDEYARDIFKNIIPILQVNKHKLVLSENNDKDIHSSFIPNIREINLTPFTESDINDFLHKTYSDFFPIDELKRAVLLYADLLPGNIISFIKDLLVLKIIKYSSSGIEIDNSSSTSVLLQTSHENIYRLRLTDLSAVEHHVVNFLSALNVPITELALEKLINNSFINTREVLQRLSLLNIIQPVNQSGNVLISSEGLKKYIYKNISDKRSVHHIVANSLSSLNFNRVELARHYELGEIHDKSFSVLYTEIKEAIRVSAYSYAASLLEKIIKFPVEIDNVFNAKKELAEVYFNLGRFKDTLNLLDELLEGIPDDLAENLNMLKASCLIGNGNYEEAKSLLLKIEPEISSASNKIKQQIELASAEFELNNYDVCVLICKNLIEDDSSSIIEKAKCYNLLGLINIFNENDLTNALTNLKQAENFYITAGISLKAAIMEMNLGNIYNMKGLQDKAELFWNKSFKTITAIGNLEFEAKLLLNFGIYYFDKLNYEESIKNYNKALDIFISLGNSAGEGLVLYNMGEIYLVTCEYQKSIERLNSSVQIFSRLKNLNEELESLFLLAKTYYIIGDIKQFLFISEIIGNKIEKETPSEKHNTNFDFLMVLAQIAAGNNNQVPEKLRKVINKYGEFDDKVNFAYASFVIILFLIKNNFYEEALAQINNELLKKYCMDAPVLNTELIYLEGLLSRKSDLCSRPSFDYFLEAAEFVQSSSIIEITWKVFYNLGELYKERGMSGKADEYFLYAKSVLEFMVESVTDKNIFYSLVNNTERFDAYNKLTTLHKKTIND